MTIRKQAEWKHTKAEFRRKLNEEFKGKVFRNGNNGQYHQRTREYGDYLYSQDREMFNYEYSEWLKTLEATR